MLSTTARNGGLGISLFERLESAGHDIVMLTVQYRMHPGTVVVVVVGGGVVVVAVVIVVDVL